MDSTHVKACANSKKMRKRVAHEQALWYEEIANPKWVKAVKGNKDDTKDSKWIGDLLRHLIKIAYYYCFS